MPVPILVFSAEGRGWFVVAEPVGTVKKPERSVRGFFKPACGNRQQEVAEGYLDRFPTAAAVSTGFLSFLVLFSFFVKIGRKSSRQDRL
jgi:hypothetical protein